MQRWPAQKTAVKHQLEERSAHFRGECDGCGQDDEFLQHIIAVPGRTGQVHLRYPESQKVLQNITKGRYRAIIDQLKLIAT